MGVGEVVGADDTGTDSLLAGRETTDWPGHRRQRSRVLRSCGREPDSRRVTAFSGQLFSSRPSALNPQDGRRGTEVWDEPNPAVQRETAFPFLCCGHQVLLLPEISTVTPLRHLVGASQVCGVLFLYFQVSLRPAGSQSGSKGGPMPCPLIATWVGFQGVVNTVGWG